MEEWSFLFYVESNFNTLKTEAFFPLVLLDFTIVLNLKEQFQVLSIFSSCVN